MYTLRRDARVTRGGYRTSLCHTSWQLACADRAVSSLWRQLPYELAGYKETVTNSLSTDSHPTETWYLVFGFSSVIRSRIVLNNRVIRNMCIQYLLFTITTVKPFLIGVLCDDIFNVLVIICIVFGFHWCGIFDVLLYRCYY